jgi:hypothetical protein
MEKKKDHSETQTMEIKITMTEKHRQYQSGVNLSDPNITRMRIFFASILNFVIFHY